MEDSIQAHGAHAKSRGAEIFATSWVGGRYVLTYLGMEAS